MLFTRFAFKQLITMKHLPLLFGFLISISGISQTLFKEIPSTPANPSSGTVTAGSGNIMLSDDGKVYSAYIQFNGTDYYLYVDQFIGGAWTPVYQELVYGGFQQINSHKIGNDIYFSVKTADPTPQPLFKIFKISGGTVNQLAANFITNYNSNTKYDFVVSAGATHAYFLHRDISMVNTILTQIDLSNSATTSLTIPAGGANVNTFDMVERFDTVFVAFSGFETSHNLYLLKVPSDMSTAYTYDNSSLGIVPGTSTTSAQEVMIGYNTVANNISINTRVTGTNMRFTYDLTGTSVSQSITTFVSTSYEPPVTLSEIDGLYHFGVLYDGSSAVQDLMVIKEDLNTFATDTIGDFTFNGIATQASGYRMGYSAFGSRVGVSYFDNNSVNRKFYLSNDAPAVLPGSITQGTVCNNAYSTIFSNVSISDANYDNINIFSITSDNTLACDPASLYVGLNQSNGTVQDFYIAGPVGTSGTFTLTLNITDGFDTIQYVMPAVTIINPGSPQWIDDTLHICSGNGVINFNDYVTPAGGSFFSNALEQSFPNGEFDTDNSPFIQDQYEFLSYETTVNGCWMSSDVVIITHAGPAVSVSTTPTSCGASNGSAAVSITGGLTPYNYQQWSTGDLDVSSVTNLSAGQYTYTLEDANQCVKTVVFEVGLTGADATAVIQAVQCFGQSNGSISVTPTGLVAPITYLWSSGHSTASITNLEAGAYTVQISDASSCVITKTFVVSEPEKLTAETNYIFPNCGLADGIMEVINLTGGVTPYSVSWSTGDLGTVVNNVPFGMYSATITDQNGCQTIKTFYMSENNSADLYGTITPTTCGSNIGAIDVSPWLWTADPIESIQWSNGATTEDIANLAPANYICTLTVANTGCRAIKGWNIPIVAPELQPICVVTVDSATTTNLVVWEPVQQFGIAYYNIYRETSLPGEYIKIDTVEATNLSVFNDVVASPIVRSWSYRISAVNGCEIEGPISPAHRTIQLNVLNPGSGVQISWNNYEGTTDYNEQKLWRYTDASGWVLAATLPVTAITYNDAIPFNEPGLDYMVELELNNLCTAVIYKAQDFNTTRSNKDKGAFSAGQGTGDSNNSIDETYMGAIEVYPNPAHNQLTIEQLEANEMYMEILTLSGQVVSTNVSSGLTSNINIDQLESGTYLLLIRIGDRSETRRFVKQ